MLRGAVFVAVLGLALGLTGPNPVGTEMAAAAGCYSPNEVRSAVEAGQVVQLSSVLAQIRAAVPGEIVTQPQLCDMGGRLVYMVDVLNGGVVTHVQIDAQTGSVSY